MAGRSESAIIGRASEGGVDIVIGMAEITLHRARMVIELKAPDFFDYASFCGGIRE